MKEVKSEQEKEKFPRETGEFFIAHKRWLVREITAGRMSIQQAIDRFDFQSKDPYSLLRTWCKRYAPEISVSLPVMTEKERHKQEILLKRVKQLEKQLEDAQMKNNALEALIDVAEEQLKIPIRKKAGARQ
jgi:transposase